MTAVGSADRYRLDKGGRDRPMDTRHAMLRPTYMLGPVHIVFFLRYSSVYILCLLLASVCVLCMAETMCTLWACYLRLCVYCSCRNACVHFVLATPSRVCTVHDGDHLYTLCLLLPSVNALCMAASLKGCA